MTIAVELSQHEFEMLLAGLHSQLSRISVEVANARSVKKTRLQASYDALRLRYDQLNDMLDAAAGA